MHHHHHGRTNDHDHHHDHTGDDNDMAKSADIIVKLDDEHFDAIKRAAERTELDDARADYIDADARYVADAKFATLAHRADAARRLVAALDAVRSGDVEPD